jgi:hypothetical protein
MRPSLSDPEEYTYQRPLDNPDLPFDDADPDRRAPIKYGDQSSDRAGTSSIGHRKRRISLLGTLHLFQPSSTQSSLGFPQKTLPAPGFLIQYSVDSRRPRLAWLFDLDRYSIREVGDNQYSYTVSGWTLSAGAGYQLLKGRQLSLSAIGSVGISVNSVSGTSPTDSVDTRFRTGMPIRLGARLDWSVFTRLETTFDLGYQIHPLGSPVLYSPATGSSTQVATSLSLSSLFFRLHHIIDTWFVVCLD